MSGYHLVICLNPTMQKTLRLARLEPGQVNRARAVRLDASGKGVNTARILHQLGERAVHLTQGGGRHLKTFLALAAEDGLDVRVVEGELEIRHCYTLLDDDNSSTTEIVEPGGPVPERLEDQLRERYTGLLAQAHTVIISGSKAPGFSDALYPEMVREARERGVRVVLDFRGTDLVSSLPHHPSVVKINVSEFSATFLDEALAEETPPESMPDAITEQMLGFARRWETELVLTNGSQPVMYCDAGRVATIAPARVEPVNAIGSGDAVTAGIAAGLHRGLPLREAIELGLDCARRNVQLEKPGTIR
jgi:1-phosphofructokinase/tagatose 6-phosphate kinase